MESRPLREQLDAMKQSFFEEELLDQLQFIQLEHIALYERNPNFAEQMLTLYFREAPRLLDAVKQTMEIVPIDFHKIDLILYRFKGTSAGIGANKVRKAINKTKELFQKGDLEGAKAAFKELRNEYDTLKAKLQPYFQQLRLAGPIETAMRPMSEAVLRRR